MKDLLVVVLFFSFLNLSSQTRPDTISFHKGIFKVRGEILKFPQLLELTKNNFEAYKEIKKARADYTATMVFSFIGGFCIGFPLGRALANKQPVWSMLAVGVGLVGIAIPFNYSFAKHAKKGVRIYNSIVE